MFRSFLLLPSLLFLLAPSLPLAHGAATDTLMPGQSLKDDGRPVLSSGKDFALGFFSPSNSTGRRYVGIWFNSIPGNAIVWVANRDAPINDSSGTFTLQPNGSLIVSDKSQAVLWSSASSAASVNSSSNSNTKNVVVPGLSAQLLDSGNFIVKSNASGGSILWQMFEATTGDTFIPGMRFLLNTRTKETRLYTSWAAVDDPRRGEFTAGFDPHGSKQVFMWKGPSSVPQWRTGQWDGQGFTEVDNLQPLDEYGYKYFEDKEKGEMYFTFVVPNSTFARFMLTAEGRVEQYVSAADRSWDLVWLQPMPCEVYNRCGNYAVCSSQPQDQQKNPQDQQPTCKCLKGYRPRDAVEWNLGNWSGGCLRRTPLSCQQSNSNNVTGGGGGGGDQDWFFRMAGVKLPDKHQWVGDVDDDGCRRICTANCSCSAYAYNTRIGCEFWNVDLADIRFSAPGTPNDLNLRLAASERDPAKKSARTIILVCAILGGVFIIFAIFGLLWKLKRSRTKASGQRKEDGESSLALEMEMIKEENHGDAPDLPLLNFEAVETATENFNPSNLLGKGGFGLVYKGTLPNGQEIAVKRLSRTSGQGSEEFKTEVILIAKLQHRNLVRLMGCSIKGDEKILVYEYMPNKSLDAFLFDPQKRALLDWTTRFKIIEGIARGLLYLHHDSRLRVVHRDLKVSNILLDEGMEPKISDFGMARIFGLNQYQANTERVVGTYGYMSPEYAMDGQFSVKSDVYSFGVLLLEIISGKKNQIVPNSGPTRNLLVYGWQLWSNGSGLEFLDPSIRSGCNEQQQVLRCIQVGLLCVQDRPSDRPAMSSVVLMLISETATCPPPKQPTFTPERRAVETDSSTSRNTGCSSAEMTMTEITGR